MTKTIWIAFSLTAALALSACGKKLDSSTKEFDDVVKNNQGEIDKIKVPTIAIPGEQGGQPGTITIQGAVVDKDGRLNSLISVKADAGKGLDGKRPAVDESSKPVIKVKTEMKELTNQLADKTIVAIGECNSEMVQRIANESGFKVVPFVEAKADEVTQVVSANSVILCGKISFKKSLVAISAANLVLTNVSWDIVGDLALASLQAEKLILSDNNRITLTAKPGSIIAPSFTLNVRGEFLPATGARLDIESLGSEKR